MVDAPKSELTLRKEWDKDYERGLYMITERKMLEQEVERDNRETIGWILEGYEEELEHVKQLQGYGITTITEASILEDMKKRYESSTQDVMLKIRPTATKIFSWRDIENQINFKLEELYHLIWELEQEDLDG